MSAAKSKVEDKEDAGAQTPHQLDPAVLEKIAEIRSRISETFGKVALVMMATPRITVRITVTENYGDSALIDACHSLS